jgi:hypothetical protein
MVVGDELHFVILHEIEVQNYETKDELPSILHFEHHGHLFFCPFHLWVITSAQQFQIQNWVRAMLGQSPNHLP